MGFQPTTLCDLVGRSNHWATGDSMVSKGQFVGLDWNLVISSLVYSVIDTTRKFSMNKKCHLMQTYHQQHGLACHWRSWTAKDTTEID